MITCCITYSKTTHESAEHGDTSDHGFYGPGGWFFSIAETGYDPAQDTTEEWKPGELAAWIHSARTLGIYDCGCMPRTYDCCCSRWSSVDPDVDFQTGEETRYSLHIDGITPATRRRIHRLLKGEPIFG